MITEKALDTRFGNRVPTEREALEVSIEKWEGLVFETTQLQDIKGNSCGLCLRYRKGDCGGCPLKGCGVGSDWQLAADALLQQNKVQFMWARQDLLTRMREALEE